MRSHSLVSCRDVSPQCRLIAIARAMQKASPQGEGFKASLNLAVGIGFPFESGRLRAAAGVRRAMASP